MSDHLTADEERELVTRYREYGDMAARDELIVRNIGLAHMLALRWSEGVAKHVPLDDLSQEAVLGLMRAVETYDPDLGRFGAYAGHWIKNRLMRATAANYSLIHRPKHLIGRDAADAGDDGRRRRVEAAAVAVVRATGREHRGRGSTVLDLVVARESCTGTDADDIAMVERLIGVLPAREALVIRRRFFDSIGLKEVGKELGITKERARQIESWALELMRRAAAKMEAA